MSNDERVDIPGIVGSQVYSVGLRNGVELKMRIGRADSVLTIETAFALTNGSGATFTIEPLPYEPLDANVPTHVGYLLGSIVTDLDVRRSGTLAMAFSNGTAIRVPISDWESWSLSWPGGRIISLPGGGI